MNAPLLHVEEITVDFNGFKALDGLSLTLMPKTVRVLIGPNGAGKSTLLDAIIGRVRPSKGRILFKGNDITRVPEYRIVRNGICRKFQAPGVLGTLSVYDNLVLAARHRLGWWTSFHRGQSPELRDSIDEILELTGLGEKSTTLAAHLSHGQKQWLEIGMVVASKPDLLLLDEPAAGMSHDEAAQTAQLIRRLSSQYSILVIDHDMGFVAQLDAPVSVLHMGRLLMEGTLEEVRRDPEVAAVYLGRTEEAASDCA
ncbi:MAG: urea ABC transporter ATP-binding protein UrtD [Acidobacteriota bacterium]|nr:urea ABC transporter ATP-binding protein UrtD [Acidobacteriota bacterium]